ncbi:geranylgeranyl diphosphate synthase type I [Prauserella shujinwangii]|uniref:Geranylgeranyl diphosphate synthase type I n=1 Tax=Prauserella shujinwangii TaxID=1453103 RepID=A0A2T0LQX6_9PSEU|nr:polyprenyl synthetase family protein [Prauserella shujinwangii]PRX45909.1 geranylgeranyl diphosphate synthase type I [Prauserella shujinwangii]
MTATLPVEITATRELVQPALRAAVDELEPSMRRIVSYHLGWLDEHGEEVTAGGGKALRPALALLAAQAVRAEPEAALPGAVAVELVHNFSLLHDDVMDGDTERRHRPTVWRLFGTPAAILAGDALLTLAVDVLERAADPAATSCLTESVQQLISGQSKDVDFEHRTDVELGECLEMADGKTGALMRCAARVGGLLGKAEPEAADLLGGFGGNLGLAFQLVDDVLGIWGSPEVTGKPVLADLRVRKKSVPVVAAFASGTPEGERLRELYRQPDPPTEEELHRMADLIERSGALSWTRDAAERYAAEARTCLDRLRPPAEIHTALADLTRFVLERDR